MSAVTCLPYWLVKHDLHFPFHTFSIYTSTYFNYKLLKKKWGENALFQHYFNSISLQFSSNFEVNLRAFYQIQILNTKKNKEKICHHMSWWVATHRWYRWSRRILHGCLCNNSYDNQYQEREEETDFFVKEKAWNTLERMQMLKKKFLKKLENWGTWHRVISPRQPAASL